MEWYKFIKFYRGFLIDLLELQNARSLQIYSSNGTITQLYKDTRVMEWSKSIVIERFPYLHTWVMEWNKYIVIKRFLYSSQCRRHDFGCSINHLDQVIIHRSRDIEHKGQSGGPWGNIFLWGDKSWPQKEHKQKTASHGHTHGQNITARLGQWNNVIREGNQRILHPTARTHCTVLTTCSAFPQRISDKVHNCLKLIK